jgi:ribosome modulation factor
MIKEDFSRAARRALRQKRGGVLNKDSLISLMKQGERAKRSGHGEDSCPYSEGDDRRECWLDGYRDPGLREIPEGVGSALRAAAGADRAVGRGLSAAGHFAARVAQKHPNAAIGAIGGAVIGHKIAQGVEKNLPDGQHLTRGAKARWAATGAAAGAAAAAGGALAGRIRKKMLEDASHIANESVEDAVISIFNEEIEVINGDSMLKKTGVKEGVTFAARPMSFQARVKERLQEVIDVNEEDKWMQDVHPKKGALHKQLGIPADKKIPTSTLRSNAKKGGLLGKRANLALRYRGEST